MGGGIALSIKNKYPNVFREYAQFCSLRGSTALGECFIVPIGENRYVANLFGQNGIGWGTRQTNYEAIERAIKTLGAWAKANNLSVGVPYLMSCGLAGGDWSIIESYLIKYIDDLTIVKFNK